MYRGWAVLRATWTAGRCASEDGASLPERGPSVLSRCASFPRTFGVLAAGRDTEPPSVRSRPQRTAPRWRAHQRLHSPPLIHILHRRNAPFRREREMLRDDRHRPQRVRTCCSRTRTVARGSGGGQEGRPNGADTRSHPAAGNRQPHAAGDPCGAQYGLSRSSQPKQPVTRTTQPRRHRHDPVPSASLVALLCRTNPSRSTAKSPTYRGPVDQGRLPLITRSRPRSGTGVSTIPIDTSRITRS